MAFDFSKLKAGLQNVDGWLKTELGALRTGRASPTLLDAVSVEVYGSRMKVSQVASITVEDARSLYVSPWDTGQLKPIEKAIMLADLGVGVGADDKGVRVTFPELTTERRQQLVKLLRAKLEEARISVRGERTKAMSAIESAEQEGGMGEDDAVRAKEEAQKLIDAANAALEATAKKKEDELLG